MSGHDDRGSAIVIAAVAMSLVLGITALVVDIGSAREHRAQAQSAADSGALAAARDVALGDTTAALATAIDIAGDNDFPSGTQVAIPPVTGTRVGDPTCVEVTTADSVDVVFGALYGRSTIDVDGRAVACTQGFGSVPAIFANSRTCSDKTLTFSGSSSTVQGGVHSNDELHLPGSTNNFFSGDFDHVGLLNIGGSGNSFDPGNPQPGIVEPMPVDFTFDDYRPGGIRANEASAAGRYHNAGNNKIDTGWLNSNTAYNDSTGELEPGLYFTNDEIDLSASDLHVNSVGVTFVAGGLIKLAGSDHHLTPWDPGQLLVFSNYMKASPVTNNQNCDGAAAEMSGSTTSWAGIIYAPRGQVKLNGSSNTTLLGSVIANTVEVSGSSLNIDSRGLGAGTPKVVLVE